jgi:hypothetical protein
MWFSTMASSACALSRGGMSVGAIPRCWSRAMRRAAPCTKRVMYGAHSGGMRSSCSPASAAASSSTCPFSLTFATVRASAMRSSRRASPRPSRYGAAASYMSANARWISRSTSARLLSK